MSKVLRQLVRDGKAEVIFGINSCTAALRAKRREVFTLMYHHENIEDNERVQVVVAEASRQKIELLAVGKEKLDMMAEKGVHQNVAMVVSPLKFEPVTEDSLRRAVRKNRARLLLFLDRIKDPHNFGNILRSAHYLGVYSVMATATEGCRLNPIVSKASAGASEFVRVGGVNNAASMLQMMKSVGWTLYGSDQQPFPNIPLVHCHETPPISAPTVLIVGSEGAGMRSSLLRLCDKIVHIPPRNASLTKEVDSLNVSVATGIILERLLSNQTVKTFGLDSASSSFFSNDDTD